MVPGGDVLFSFSMAGANIQFVLTGEESGGFALSRDEIELVKSFRAAPLAVKAAALGALAAGSSASTSSINVTGSGQRVAGRDYYEGKK